MKVMILVFLVSVLSVGYEIHAAQEISISGLTHEGFNADLYKLLNRPQKLALREDAWKILRKEMVIYYHIMVLSEGTSSPHLPLDFDFQRFFDNDPGFNAFKFEELEIKFDELMADWMVVSQYRRKLLSDLGLDKEDVKTLRLLRRMLGKDKNIQLIDEDLRQAGVGCDGPLNNKR